MTWISGPNHINSETQPADRSQPPTNALDRIEALHQRLNKGPWTNTTEWENAELRIEALIPLLVAIARAAEEVQLGGSHEGPCEHDGDAYEACSLHITTYDRRHEDLAATLAALEQYTNDHLPE